MKNLVKVFMSLFLMSSVMFAEVLDQNGQKDGYSVKFSSEKSLVVGNNAVFITY